MTMIVVYFNNADNRWEVYEGEDRYAWEFFESLKESGKSNVSSAFIADVYSHFYLEDGKIREDDL